jgi:5S rRNA maturation endonuclease (ribonuclease M5)
MKENDLYTFLNLLGIEDKDIKKSDRNGILWLNTLCPLAEYTHANGKDTHPSFGITISDIAQSVYFCFGCSTKPKFLSHLTHAFWLHTGVYPKKLNDFLAAHEFEKQESDVIEYRDMWKRIEPKAENKIALHLEIIEKFPLLEGSKECSPYTKFLQKRGIPKWVWEKYGIRYDCAANALVFPLTDYSGGIVALRERKITEKKMWTVSKSRFPDIDFISPKEHGMFFGAREVNYKKPVIIVEGELDAMRLVALNCSNVLASCTCCMTEAQADSLIFPLVVIGYDSDIAGENGCNKVIKKLQKKTKLAKVTWETALKKDGTKCKDAGDLPDFVALQKVLKNIKYINV